MYKSKLNMENVFAEKNKLTGEEFFYQMDAEYLRVYKPQWFSDIAFYLIRAFMLFVMGYAFFYTALHNYINMDVPHAAMYLATGFGFMFQILDCIKMVILDRNRYKEYKAVEKRHRQEQLNRQKPKVENKSEETIIEE